MYIALSKVAELKVELIAKSHLSWFDLPIINGLFIEITQLVEPSRELKSSEYRNVCNDKTLLNESSL